MEIYTTCKTPLELLHAAPATWQQVFRGLCLSAHVFCLRDGKYSGGLLLKMEGRCGEVGIFSIIKLSPISGSHRLQSLVQAAGLKIFAQRRKLEWPAVYLVSLDVLLFLKMVSHYTGTGEYITRSGLARALGKAFEALPNPDDDLEGIVDPHAIMQQVLVDEFWSELTANFNFDEPGDGVLISV